MANLNWNDNPIHWKTGHRANLSEIEFTKFAPNGKMSFDQFKRMCLEKDYEEVEDEELEAAFLRLNTSNSGYMTYNEYLEWWKTGIFDDSQRQMGLKFKSQEEKNEVIKARSSFFAGTGGIESMTMEQFRQKCYIAGYCLTDDELEEAFQSIDKDGNGNVDFIEYLRWRMQDDRFAHLQFEDEINVYIRQIAEFFRMYDENLKGYLTLEQFMPLYDSLVDAGRIQAAITDIIKELDAGSEGIVKLNDFVRWYATSDAEREQAEGA